MQQQAAVQGFSAAFKVKGPFLAVTDELTDVVMVSGYDRTMETTADKGGVDVARAAGYDPAGLLRFLQRLEQRQPSEASGLSGLMSTHPYRKDRIANLAAISGGSGATLADRFKVRVRDRIK